MDQTTAKRERRARRRKGLRKRIFGRPEQPRLTVYRSLNHIYAQIVDDVDGRTLVSAHSLKLAVSGDRAAAETVGTDLAKKAKQANVNKVVFDRGGFRYQGRIKSLADAARKGGLEF